MRAIDVYDRLYRDFVLDGVTDDWGPETKSIERFLTPSYKATSIGLMLDFASDIRQVYTSVFLNDALIDSLKNSKNAMIFVHHPITEYYDSDRNCVTETLSIESIEFLRKNEISVFNLHIPLDDFGEYGTNACFSEKLGFSIEDKFALYRGAYTGIICSTPFSSIRQIQRKMEKAIGHQTKLYGYGDSDIAHKKIAIVVGCGHELEVMQEMLSMDIFTLLTGVSFHTGRTDEIHAFDKLNRINVLGGTHYSTEKFALIKMREYFSGLGLPSTFIENKPCFLDL